MQSEVVTDEEPLPPPPPRTPGAKRAPSIEAINSNLEHLGQMLRGIEEMLGGHSAV